MIATEKEEAIEDERKPKDEQEVLTDFDLCQQRIADVNLEIRQIKEEIAFIKNNRVKERKSRHDSIALDIAKMRTKYVASLG